MFDFLKEKIRAHEADPNVYAVCEGQCIDISEVKDPVFSQKKLGDGVACIPEKNVIYAPCDGEICMLFPTKHAFGMKMVDGTEIVVHIGIDTVDLNGQGFQVLKKKNDRVRHSEPIVELDMDFLKKQGYDLTTMIILSSNLDKDYHKHNIGCQVSHLDKVISFGD